MIEIKDLNKSYGNLTVYNNFNLSLEEGQITCILGESGCGKTTLLNAVANLTEYGGSIPELKCSYVFQTPRLIPNLTVYGNLRLICGDDKSIYSMLERVRLADKAHSYPINLSGGQAQRVALGRAFLYKSEIILMDEPFSSLDLRLKKQIAELFTEIWKNDGRTVLFVTHDVDEAAHIAQRIVVIRGGTIIHDFKPGGSVLRGEDEAEKVRSSLIKILLDG